MNYREVTKLTDARMAGGGPIFEAASPIDRILIQYRLDTVLAGLHAEETIRTYWNRARYFLTWIDSSGIQLIELGKKEIELYRYHRMTSQAPRARGARRAPSQVYRELVGLKHFCRWALSRGYIRRDPWKYISLRRPPDREMVPLTLEELASLVQASKEFGWLEVDTARNHALLVLVSDLGLRIKTEALALDRVDVEEADCLRDQVTLGSKGRIRTVPLNPAVAVALAWYLSLRRDEHPALFVTSPYRISKPTTRLAYGSAAHVLKVIGKRAGVDREKVTWHNLRRTSATQALLSGVDMFTVMAIYGWRNISTVQRYVGAGAKREALATHRQHSLAGRLLDSSNYLEESGGMDRSIGGTTLTSQYRHLQIVRDSRSSITQD